MEDAGLFYFAKGPLDFGPLHQAAQPLARGPCCAGAALLPPSLHRLCHLRRRPCWSLPQGWAPPPSAAASLGMPASTQARQLVREKDDAAAWPLLQAVGAAPASRGLFARLRAVGAQGVHRSPGRGAAGAIERDAWNVDACLLLGLAAKWQSQAAVAISGCARRCTPNRGAGLPTFLADLLRAQGALEQACRSWRVVLQQRQRPRPRRASATCRWRCRCRRHAACASVCWHSTLGWSAPQVLRGRG